MRNKGWQATNCFFTNQEFVIDLINKMARALGRRITYQSPRLNAILPGGARLHASIPPISSLELTIRKYRENPITIFELSKFRTLTSEALAVLWLVMQSDLSVLIAGNTSSGKTTTLNALFSFVPLRERVLITEETPEINIPHPHTVKLLSNPDLSIGMKDLVADSLRMRPDRVIVGEVRTSEEVSALIETVLSGQARGSYATFHAQSANEALQRLRSLGVLEADLSSLDLILVQRRMLRYDPKTHASIEVRRATEIAEIMKGAAPSIRPLFAYSQKDDALLPKYSNSPLLARIRDSFNISEKELRAEIAKRKKFIESMRQKSLTFQDSVRELQSFAYKD